MIKIGDYAGLRKLSDVKCSIYVAGVNFSSRKAERYAGVIVSSDHVATVMVAAGGFCIPCTLSHRLLTTTLTHPFEFVSEACLRWIKVSDLRQGMPIAVAPSGPCTPPSICTGRYIMGHKIHWSPVSRIYPSKSFEHYSVSVTGGSNYIMNNIVSCSHGYTEQI